LVQTVPTPKPAIVETSARATPLTKGARMMQTPAVRRPRRIVTALYRTHVGKESDRLEEVDAGLIHDPEEVYTEYVDPQHDPEWEALVAKLKDIQRTWLMQETGLARSTITALRHGCARPTRKTREMLQRAAQQTYGTGVTHWARVGPIP
jgi:hypothetical protein